MNNTTRFYDQTAQMATIVAAICLALPSISTGQTADLSAVRGLWVGQITLGEVNEVVDAVDENNEFVRKPPEKTTPTADAAHLRLIVHVNGAGQASLLKGVAVLNRNSSRVDPDLALITDHRLFAEFPRQVAKRIASAAYEFGDLRAVNAVRAAIQAAADAAATSANNGDSIATIESNAASRVGEVVSRADVDASYRQFLEGEVGGLLSVIKDAAVTYTVGARGMGTGGVPAADIRADILLNGTGVRTALESSGPALATNFDGLGADAEFNFGDSRGTDAMNRILLAAAQAASDTSATSGDPAVVGAAVQAAIDRAAAEVADVGREYARFVAGGLFYEARSAAIQAATTTAVALVGGGLSLPDFTSVIIDATNQDPKVSEARVFAVENVQETPPLSGLDTRAVESLRATTEAIAIAVATIIHGGGGEESARIAGEEAADAAGLTFPIARASASAPDAGYNQFIASPAFTGLAARLAPIVASAAKDTITDSTTIIEAELIAEAKDEAELIATNFLGTELGLAAGVSRNELPMLDGLAGGFTPGGSLSTTLSLPANHPTNPFRHRRSNGHRTGFDISRHVNLAFVAPEDGDTPSPVVVGSRDVDTIAGIYEEEIFGLHKPLTGQGGSEVGLRVKGSFTLHRISYIDTLNAK